jgi:hypothetical protein
LRNLLGTATASRWSAMFHEILHNVEELPQFSGGGLQSSMFCVISIRDPSRIIEFTRPSLLVFSHFLSFLTFCFHALRIFFRYRFFSYLRHHTPRVRHSFLYRQMPRLNFYDHWVQYERSPANTLDSCIDPNWLHSYCCGLPNGQPLC